MLGTLVVSAFSYYVAFTHFTFCLRILLLPFPPLPVTPVRHIFPPNLPTYNTDTYGSDHCAERKSMKQGGFPALRITAARLDSDYLLMCDFIAFFALRRGSRYHEETWMDPRSRPFCPSVWLLPFWGGFSCWFRHILLASMMASHVDNSPCSPLLRALLLPPTLLLLPPPPLDNGCRPCNSQYVV